MITKGDEVTIKASKDLVLMGLSKLRGQKGKVTQLLMRNKTPGVMVRFFKKVMDHSYWFVPISAVSVTKSKCKHKIDLINETIL